MHCEKDPFKRQILQSAKHIGWLHDMSMTESIRQALKLRKHLFETLWPNHEIEEITECLNNNDGDAAVEETT